MIEVTFKYADNDREDTFRYPAKLVGIKRNGRRPVSCEITGDSSGEDMDKLKGWVYGNISRSMDPSSKTIVIEIKGFTIKHHS